MKKLEKKDYKNIAILISFIMIFLIILLFKGELFGSRVDWASQHVVYPDYFRKLFYETGKLIPSFALNLGGGENIFYFSYYGFLSPISLFSYLLPFIPIYIYMPLISIISLIASVIMFYKWINNKYDSKVAFIASILFLLNSTFFYHFHRHIMFVIYMPFLIGALRSVDLYFREKKILPLIIFSFLTVMTNYYFGAYSIIFIGVYTIYLLLKNKKFEFKKLFSIIFYEIIAILLAGVLLLPTMYALVNGRIPTTIESSISFIDLFLLKTNFDYTFYASYYSWGLTFIYVVAIIYGFMSKKKEFKFLSLILSLMILFPIFSYVLNGMMYVDGKCYLAFIPIAIILVADFIKEYVNKKIDVNKYLKYIIIVSIVLIVSAIKSNCILLLILDIFVTTYFLMRNKTKNIYYNFIPIIAISLISFIASSLNESYIKIKDYKSINNSAYEEIMKDDDKIYRTSIDDDILLTVNRVYNINTYRTSLYSSLVNKNYFDQFRNVFQNEIYNRDNYVLSQTSNILFNIYTGTKYLVTKKEAPIGYKEINKIDDITLYQNDDILPLAYVSNKLMSKREFLELEYPKNMEALLKYVVVDEELDDVFESDIEKIDLDYKLLSFSDLEYAKAKGHYIINAKKNAKMNIGINNDLNNKILFIKFKMNESKKGFACSSEITINGIKNALSCDKWKYHNSNYTFEYVLSNLNELEIKFTNDKFDLSDFEFYIMDYSKIEELKDNIEEVHFKKVADNILESNITINNSGVLKMTIPYEEKGFEVLVDDKKVDIIKVDETYIGFKLDKGNHYIALKYEAPFLKEGKVLSLVGLITLILTLSVKNRKRHLFK